MLIKSIQTDRLILKNLTAEAASGPYYQWLRDETVNQFLEVRHSPPSCESLKTYIEQMNQSKNHLLLGIYLPGDVHIGNIKLGPIQTFYSRAHLGLVIGDKTQWGKGYASEVIHQLTQFAFEKLGLQSVRAGCYANNVGSLKAFLKTGYVESGRQPRYWKVGDQFVDNVLLVKFHES